MSSEAIPPTPPLASSSHLSYPTIEPVVERLAVPAAPPARQLLTDRLFVGNLHPTVDEYTLLQIFSKFGKVTKLDYLFHKTGLLKGKPRGYAFIEYANNIDAQKALDKANDKLLRGRKLAVTFAHQAPLDSNSEYIGLGGRHRKTLNESGRPTTLSMIKSTAGGRHRGDGTHSKIAQLEAKLRQMEETDPNYRTPSSSSTLPQHPSLPAKPPATIPNDDNKPRTNVMRTSGSSSRSSTPLPSFPMMPPRTPQASRSTPPARASERPKPTKSILGIRRKPKPKAETTPMDVDVATSNPLTPPGNVVDELTRSAT